MTFIGGASHGKSRNGEAERVANRVRRESVDAGASLEYCQQPPAGANAAETPPRKGRRRGLCVLDGDGSRILKTKGKRQ